MDAVKQRRLIAESQVFSLLESSEEELLAGGKILDEMAARILDTIYTKGTFLDLVKQKRFKASTITLGGEPAFVMVYTINALGWLTIEGVASLKKSPFKLVFDAGDLLARHYGCNNIQFVTKLASLYRFGLARGYKTVGVIMCKNAPPA
jgi:hypothetical protein